MIRAWLSALFAVLVALPARADDAAVTKAASDFYGAARAAGSGLPSAAARAKLTPLMTPGLASLLDQAAAAEDAFAAANKDTPPLVEGDLYSSLFEGPTSFAIGTCTGDTTNARCAVNLRYNDSGGQGPTVWTDTIFLANTSSGWKVADIGYGGTWAFGNKGRLSDTLKATIEDVPH